MRTYCSRLGLAGADFLNQRVPDRHEVEPLVVEKLSALGREERFDDMCRDTREVDRFASPFDLIIDADEPAPEVSSTPRTRICIVPERPVLRWRS